MQRIIMIAVRLENDIYLTEDMEFVMLGTVGILRTFQVIKPESVESKVSEIIWEMKRDKKSQVFLIAVKFSCFEKVIAYLKKRSIPSKALMYDKHAFPLTTKRCFVRRLERGLSLPERKEKRALKLLLKTKKVN